MKSEIDRRILQRSGNLNGVLSQ